MTFSRKDTAIAKAVAIVLMFMHHLFLFNYRLPEGVYYLPLTAHNFEEILAAFGKLCVMMFVCLSGFGTYKSLSKTDNTASFVLKKIYGLYKKYWSVFLIFIPIGMWLGIERISRNLVAFIYNFIGLNTSYNGEWWFFPPFILLCIVSPLLIKFINRKWSSPAVDFLLIILISAFCRYIIPQLFDLKFISAFSGSYFGIIFEKLFYFIPSFLMGAAIAKYNLFDKYLSFFKKWYFSVPVSLILMFITLYMRTKTGDSGDYIFAPVFIIASVSFIRGIPPLSFIACELGSVSTELWLTHSFFCYHFIPRIVYAPRYSILVLIWLLIISYAASKLLVIAVNLFNKLVKRNKGDNNGEGLQKKQCAD